MVVPQLILGAISDAGEQVSAIVSMTEATFVNGVFAPQTVTPSAPGTPAFTSAVAGKVIHFVMPGTTLAIFPVGLVITGSWAAVFVAVVGYGTVGRLRFREQYRRRIRREMARGVKTL